jgi:hypothetical protein
MNLADGEPLHVEMISRKEVLIRKEQTTTLTGGLAKLKSLRGIISGKI